MPVTIDVEQWGQSIVEDMNEQLKCAYKRGLDDGSRNFKFSEGYVIGRDDTLKLVMEKLKKRRADIAAHFFNPRLHCPDTTRGLNAEHYMMCEIIKEMEGL